MSETHVAGLEMLWSDRWLRQRCAWCGKTLLDYDLGRLAVREGEGGGPGFWPVGKLVRIDGPVMTVLDDERSIVDETANVPPPDSCLHLDPAVTA